MAKKPDAGLSEEARNALLSRLGARASRAPEAVARPAVLRTPSELPNFREIRMIEDYAALQGLSNPYFRTHQARSGSMARVDGRMLVDFTSYDYLGLNAHPKVVAAAKQALEEHGVSSSASRVTGGQRSVHEDLEAAIARMYDAEACLTFVSGYATNVSVLGQIAGPKDLIVCDSVAHNSVMIGARLSGARRHLFPHNEITALETFLAANRSRYRQVFIVVEGHYSMDGDVADLPALVRIRERYDAWLMVDEAHSVGVLGAKGYGIAEHCGVDPAAVDLWMGTLSKTLAGCGGYIAGSAELIGYLKLSVPGFVYSVAMPPAIAAAARVAIETMEDEPWRIAALRANARHFLERCRAAGLNTGTSIGASIVPVILGGSIEAARASQRLFEAGYNALPIVAPAVPEGAARLRFFITCAHSPAQIDEAVANLATIAS